MPDKTVLELYHELMLVYERCIRAKPAFKKSRFHLEYPKEVYGLAHDIHYRRYRPSISNIFVVFYPKPREIIAAHLRDRIVHHYIYEYMSPYWERRFSAQSYACRKGKGALRAVLDLCEFMRGYRAHASAPLYALKVDIAAFFPTLDLDILQSIIMKKLSHPLYRYLVDVTLRHRPVDPGQFVLKSPRIHWQSIPTHKSMFYAPRRKGLPIGNLTSQFFANIYMNELDQFITHHLKGQYAYWQRYVDDIVFLSPNPDSLRKLPAALDAFLGARLSLQLNPSKTILQPTSRGMDHLGFWIKPDHLLIRQKNINACMKKLGEVGESPEAMQATLNSYLGFFRHAASRSLRSKVDSKLPGLFNGRLEMDPSKMKVILKPDQQKIRDEAVIEQSLFKEFSLHTGRESRAVAWKAIGPVLRDAEFFLT